MIIHNYVLPVSILHVVHCCAKTCIIYYRFLTLVPPISLSLRLGSSPPSSSSQTPTLTLPNVLVHPYMLRGIFIVILSTSATAYIAFLIRSSRQRHYKSIKSVRMRKHSSRVACLKGHTQVRIVDSTLHSTIPYCQCHNPHCHSRVHLHDNLVVR